MNRFLAAVLLIILFGGLSYALMWAVLPRGAEQLFFLAQEVVWALQRANNDPQELTDAVWLHATAAGLLSMWVTVVMSAGVFIRK